MEMKQTANNDSGTDLVAEFELQYYICASLDSDYDETNFHFLARKQEIKEQT
jgi:hypothetical protein